jgi:hypothetical protein
VSKTTSTSISELCWIFTCVFNILTENITIISHAQFGAILKNNCFLAQKFRYGINILQTKQNASGSHTVLSIDIAKSP